MKSFKQFLTESQARRAWNGGLQHIDDLLAWMYDKDILTKTEKAEKDKIFNDYYRYYNDGDFPRALNSKGLTIYSSKEDVEKALEEYLNDFIKKILSKYAGKYNRKDFRYDRLIKQLDNVLEVCDIDSDQFSPFSIAYWANYIPNKDDQTLKILQDLEKEYKVLKKNMESVEKSAKDELESKIKFYYEGDLSGKVLNLAIKLFKEHNLWNNVLEKQSKKVKALALDLELKLRNIKIAARKAFELGVID